MSTPTPRTDAKLPTVAERTSPHYLPEMVYANFARTLERELAAERARLRQLALDSCRSAAIVPVVWYPTGYYVNPNDLGKINKQQVDACVAAIDAAIKEVLK